MPITAEAPAGGIIEQLGGESRPMVLRQGEIERFERQHNLGIFLMLDLLLGKVQYVTDFNGNFLSLKSSHCRDLVALGLVGGGLLDKTADKIIGDLPPNENHRVRLIAQELVFAAFMPDDLKKKIDDLDGSSSKTAPKDTTQKKRSKVQSPQG
jgi:hypothetical protein